MHSMALVHPLGRGCGGVSLSYDGATLQHLELALADLADLRLTATFYGDPYRFSLNQADWKCAARLGHELGNGALLGAALPDGSLPAWTPDMIADELDECERYLQAQFGFQGPHSVALPLGPPRCRDGEDYREQVLGMDCVCRSGVEGVNAPESCDRRYLRCIPATHLTGVELVQLARAATDGARWIVFAFQAVGQGAGALSRQAHRDLCLWLAENRDSVPSGSVMDVALGRHASAAHAFRLA